MKQTPNLETLQQQTIRIYKELKQEHGEADCMRWFGGFHGLKDIIKAGGLQDLYSWLRLPADDWQKDC